MRPPLLAAALVLVAGCLQVDPEGNDAPPDSSGLAPSFLPPIPVSKEWPGAEPVVAVTSDGKIFVEGIGRHPTVATNVNKVFRSTDRGATWKDVTPPAMGQERSNDGFVAVGNGDAVYAANVFSLSFQLFRSDDLGETWIPLEPPRVPMLMHRHWIVPTGASRVHVVVEALPPAFLPYLAGQPPPDEAPANPNEGLWYFRSDDKGATWTTPVRIDPVVNFAGQGTMAVSVDGQRLYVARFEEKDAPRYEPTYTKGHWYLLASEDGGATWQRREMFDLTSELSTAVPSVALDDAGTLYFAWSQASNGTSIGYYAHSNDARTWSAPIAFTPANQTVAMAFGAAPGPAGRLSILWYAADVPGPASKVNAPWHVDYAHVSSADTDHPAIHTTRTTDAPVHQGNICARGPACGTDEDRRLLDYPWLAFDADGLAHGVFASTMWDNPSAFAVFTREETLFSVADE